MKIFRLIVEILHVVVGLQKNEDPQTKSKFKKRVLFLVLGIFVIMMVLYSVTEPYKIPSGSMIPTLKVGDQIFANKLAYGLRLPFLGEVIKWSNPKRGDVFIFVPPTNPDVVYVKRVIGVPGDTIRIEDDKLYINGEYLERVPENYFPAMNDVEDEYNENNHQLYIENLLGIKHYALFFKERYLESLNRSMEIVVPADSYFAMGDNRDHSQDSRFWGFVSRDAVKGKAFIIWLSLNWTKMFTPSWIRFSRTGKIVH